jgi:uncharacterized protein
MFFFDPTYLLFALPGLALALWAQWKVKSTFKKFAQVPTSTGLNGVDAAQRLTRSLGLNVGLQQVAGELTDHYDPRSKTVALSQSSVINSVASVAVVAHEFGHAMQDKENYGPLKLRGAIVPAVQVGSWVAPFLFMGGMLLGLGSGLGQTLAWIGVGAFGIAAFFALVTLPVEFDASRRALVMIRDNRLLSETEIGSAKQVLDAAALTYVAAAAQSLLTLMYYVMLLTGARRRDE